MSKALALIVDDEADIRELVEITLARMGLRTRSAATLAEARRQLTEHPIDLCITDMRLPDGNGIGLVEYIQTRHPQVPVAVITAYGNAQAAVESLKAGAFDFVSKPVDLAVLRRLVDEALRLRSPPEGDPVEQGLLGDSEIMRKLRVMIERLARSQAPVHISGESGSGKERVARLIHARGPRARSPFIPVNCGAIPAELMESEFFGHLKGSFTSANRDKPGLFMAAENGTLFLDEVGELPLHMQVKLLRALQERAVKPVGAEKEVPVNVRIISATHKNLAALVAQGVFRQDLYYRLNVIGVQAPALREHLSDIPVIASAILVRIAREAQLQEPPQLDKAALNKLMTLDYPGNVRELENILERAVALSDGRRITVEDLRLQGFGGEPEERARPPLPQHLQAMERHAIREALERAKGNKTRAAELLGMTFRQLRYKIKKLNIE